MRETSHLLLTSRLGGVLSAARSVECTIGSDRSLIPYSLEDGAKVLEKRAIRTLGVEGVRGLARARLANLAHVCSNYRQSGLHRGREKAYYENARQAHYERFGPRAFYRSGRDNTPPSLEVRSRWLVSRIVTEDWVKFREN